MDAANVFVIGSSPSNHHRIARLDLMLLTAEGLLQCIQPGFQTVISWLLYLPLFQGENKFVYKQINESLRRPLKCIQ